MFRMCLGLNVDDVIGWLNMAVPNNLSGWVHITTCLLLFKLLSFLNCIIFTELWLIAQRAVTKARFVCFMFWCSPLLFVSAVVFYAPWATFHNDVIQKKHFFLLWPRGKMFAKISKIQRHYRELDTCKFMHLVLQTCEIVGNLWLFLYSLFMGSIYL